MTQIQQCPIAVNPLDMESKNDSIMINEKDHLQYQQETFSSLSPQAQILLSQVQTQFLTPINNPAILKNLSNELQFEFLERLKNSTIAMLPSPDMNPTGLETGLFLVMDLGGSTLRLAFVLLNGNSSNSSTDKADVITEDSWIIHDDDKILNLHFFHWIADRINDVLNKLKAILKQSSKYNTTKVNMDIINVGISWSFPISLKSVNHGIIENCGKGWSVDSQIHYKDLKPLLESIVLEKIGIKLSVESIINDSVAVYIASCYNFKMTKLGLVLGTGTNCCIRAPTKFLSKHKFRPYIEGVENCLINTELSTFGNDFIKYSTNWDPNLDVRFDDKFNLKSKIKSLENQILNGENLFQLLEYTSSGRYISELTRLIMIDFIEMKEFLNGKLPKNFDTKYDYFTGELTCMINESTTIDEAKLFFLNHFSKDYNNHDIEISDNDILLLQKIIDIVITRGAALISICIISLSNWLDQLNTSSSSQLSNDDNDNDTGIDEVCVGYVGSVLRHFHKYRSKVEFFLIKNNDLNLKKKKYILKYVKDSSILGPAIAAAVNLNEKI